VRIDTAHGRPDLHVAITTGPYVCVSQIAKGIMVRCRLSPDEALAVADALVDTVESLT